MPVLTPPEQPRDWSVEDITVTEPDVIRRAIGAAAIGNITDDVRRGRRTRRRNG